MNRYEARALIYVMLLLFGSSIAALQLSSTSFAFTTQNSATSSAASSQPRAWALPANCPPVQKSLDLVSGSVEFRQLENDGKYIFQNPGTQIMIATGVCSTILFFVNPTAGDIEATVSSGGNFSLTHSNPIKVGGFSSNSGNWAGYQATRSGGSSIGQAEANVVAESIGASTFYVVF